MENNQMINLIDLINNCFNKNKIYIPLIQRNYKWDKATAGRLARDLWKSFKGDKDKYTIGMITLYQEEQKDQEGKNVMQLIDGQQRIVTLTLLLRYLNPEKKHFQFSFERDEGLENNELRSAYLRSIDNSNFESKVSYTDLIRFQENYKEIKEALEDDGYSESEKNNFIKFILEKVFVLFHITETEPLDEFLNINKNKTRFGICDHIKANLIIDTTKENRKNIILLFRDLSNYLFSDSGSDIWNLIGQGYIENNIPLKEDDRDKKLCYPDENRLKILFCDRYEGNSKFGYDYEPEYQLLKYYLKLLDDLDSDIAVKNNWNLYNGFNCFYEFNKMKFFELFGENYRCDILNQRLEGVLWAEIEKLNASDSFEKNCFIESQLYHEKKDFSWLDRKIKKPSDKEEWFYNEKNELKNFTKYYEIYIEEKYEIGEGSNE